ncbi:MAG TPA: M48 family metalloprotease [Oscillatoriaceae cyanobacterium]
MGLGSIFDKAFVSLQQKSGRQVGKDVAGFMTRQGSMDKDLLSLSTGARERLATSGDQALQTAVEQADLSAAKDAAGALQLGGEAQTQAHLQSLYHDTAMKALPTIDPSVDQEIGDMQIQRALKTADPVKDPRVTNYVQGVVDRLQSASHARNNFKVNVLNSDEVNAFNAGGGTMVVYTGLLKSMTNEAELAGVIGHEMTHGENRHVVQGIIEGQMQQGGAQAIDQTDNVTKSELTKGISAIKKELSPQQLQDPNFPFKDLNGVVDQGVAQHLQYAESAALAKDALQRAQESEADMGGVHRLAQAGYDPNAMVTAFQRLPKDPPAGPQDIWRDHPRTADRISAIQNAISKDNLSGTDLGSDRYQQILSLLNGKTA